MEEKIIKSKSGVAALTLITLGMLVSAALVVWAGVRLAADACGGGLFPLIVMIIVLCGLFLTAAGPILYRGLRIIRPNEAAVLTLFGKYFGTLRQEGFFYVNPFASPMPVPVLAATTARIDPEVSAKSSESGSGHAASYSKKSARLSLKTMTLNNDRQKINDKLGNPIIIGIVVIWRVSNTAKAMFNVDNFADFLSIQCDSALRGIVRLYPYDTTDDEESNETSLRTSSDEISAKLRASIQDKVDHAGLEILEARITHLAYAPEIAAAMLQRQQASAVVDARQLIVEGAVGMVEMALTRLKEEGVVALDEERKAAMVSNLMVVLCGNREAQPIINSGSLY
jgi:regulator of protease activity HflC (stomatin/prohibitin superfamily)